MIVPKKINPLQLEKLLEQLDNAENKRVIAIAGKINNRKTRMLNSLYEFKSYKPGGEKEVLPVKKDQSLRKSSDGEPFCSYQQVASLSHRRVIADITNNLKVNLKTENFVSNDISKIIKNQKAKSKKKKIVKMFDEFNNLESNQYLATRAQSLFPILTTVSTLGTSIGVPLLSITLLRVDQLLRLIGEGGFATLISFCIVLIVVGIISLMFYLFTTIRYNKLLRISKSADVVFEKIIDKYFILPENIPNGIVPKHQRNKFKISTSSNYFYNEITFSDKDYEEIVKLFVVLKHLNNNVIYTVNIANDYEIKQLYDPSWGRGNFLVVDVNDFKTPKNYRKILLFLLSEFSKILNLDAQQLYFKSKKFSRIINAFLTDATSNYQVVEILRLSKIFLTNFSTKLDHPTCRTFFFDFFTILALRALSEQNFIDFVSELESHFIVSNDSYGPVYEALDITGTLTRNWQEYGPNSILFSLSDMFSNPFWLNGIFKALEVADDKPFKFEPEKYRQETIKFILNASFVKIEDLFGFAAFKNSNEEKMLLINVPIDNENVFEWAKAKFNEAMENGITYITLLFRAYRFIYKINTGRFESIPETVL
ncbi:hypothetical protein [[Mycoplasma] testudinis]|uniref:hypothetical protein n=1 Tax=[Mycoplasma] testudinis TaxID=33924 RepID=UPI000486BBEE|nr:hypothetical protein [[Mycoplasma] testudinis]